MKKRHQIMTLLNLIFNKCVRFGVQLPIAAIQQNIFLLDSTRIFSIVSYGFHYCHRFFTLYPLWIHIIWMRTYHHITTYTYEWYVEWHNTNNYNFIPFVQSHLYFSVQQCSSHFENSGKKNYMGCDGIVKKYPWLINSPLLNIVIKLKNHFHHWTNSMNK